MATPPKKPEKEVDSFVEFVKGELSFVGLDQPDADYGGMIAEAVTELAETFSKQGHSGVSGPLTGTLFYQLVQWRPLTGVTNRPEEWMEVTENMYTKEQIEAGDKIWQNRRSPSTFSKDGGITWEDYQNHTKGKSLTVEEALNGIGGEDTTEGHNQTNQAQENSTAGTEAQAAVRASDSRTPRVQGQPITEPKDTPSASDSEKPGVMGGSQQTVARPQRPDGDEPAEAEDEGRTPKDPARKKGSSKGGKA